jgi:predicted GTPase
LIGAIGVGKSATCKSLCEDVDNVFISSAGKDSFTKKAIYKKVHWKNTNDEFMLIDTQGFLDGEKNDD